ncbi:Hydantoin utilization protein B [Cucumis melo var. makuwa]|uniref:Hydantoin utilization protein B n=1 Tax=Cucumis melo var. makuwa TaxID=1194695 RepID=A0A5D3CM64_CUCMM|nr:Hydantoin utilization protein B [Cucumis melo var. makuwa]
MPKAPVESEPHNFGCDFSSNILYARDLENLDETVCSTRSPCLGNSMSEFPRTTRTNWGEKENVGVRVRARPLWAKRGSNWRIFSETEQWQKQRNRSGILSKGIMAELDLWEETYQKLIRIRSILLDDHS